MKAKSDDVGQLTRGLSGPWIIVDMARSKYLEFACQGKGCTHRVKIEIGPHTAQELNKLAHPCGVKNIAADRPDQGYVTTRRKRYSPAG